MGFCQESSNPLEVTLVMRRLLQLLGSAFDSDPLPSGSLCPLLSSVAWVAIFSLDKSKSKILNVKKRKYKWPGPEREHLTGTPGWSGNLGSP
jgi:hypothetical protein